MKILCRAGFHRPSAGSRFNAGYRFSTCARCGSDLVKGASGRWRVPRGYRVVWKTPAEAASHILLGASSAPRGQPKRAARPELPIQEVLRLLQNYDFVDQQEPDALSEAVIAVRTEDAISRFDTADFMVPRPDDVAAAQRRSIFPDNGDEDPTPAGRNQALRKP